ncbi:MAG: ABC transporter permease [Vicinamibacterales bacterium]
MPSVSEGAADQVWTVDPLSQGPRATARELWRYRRLFVFFGVQSIKGMYQGTALGVFWLFARPLFPIVVSTLIFGGLLGAQSDGLPYFLFNLTTTSVWMLFERSLIWATRSLDMHSDLIKKLYFPRLIVPLSSVAPVLVYFGIYLTLILLASVYYLYAGHRWYLSFGPGWLVAIGSAVLAVLMAVVVGLFTSVWMTRFRDVRFGIRYVSQFWFYLTPVLYPMSQVPADLRWVIYLNPMAPIVEAYKWGLLGVGQFPLVPLLSSLGVMLVIGSAGVWYFTSSEATSVDSM